MIGRTTFIKYWLTGLTTTCRCFQVVVSLSFGLSFAFHAPPPPWKMRFLENKKRTRRTMIHQNGKSFIKSLTSTSLLMHKNENRLPVQNPFAKTSASSIAGISYQAVQSALEVLYPATELNQRTAISRTDGYWPHLKQGKDPPPELIYGEFDFHFFAALLDRAYAFYRCDPRNQVTAGNGWTEKTFVDIGSGTGRLVFAAAALHPWGLSRGIELLPGIHKLAVERKKDLSTTENGMHSLATPQRNQPLNLAPIEFVCGSFEDPYIYFGDADIIFLFSTCLPKNCLERFAESVGRQCRPGTIVITIDYMLPLEGNVPAVESNDQIPSGVYRFSLLEKNEGWVWLTGGASTAFIHRVEMSQWREGQGPWERPLPTL